MTESAESVLPAPPENWAPTHIAPAVDLLAGPEALLWVPLIRVYPQGTYCLIQLVGPFSRPEHWAARTAGLRLELQLDAATGRFDLAAPGVQTQAPAAHRCVLWNRDRGNHGTSWALWCAPLPTTALVLTAASDQPALRAQDQLHLTGEQLRGHAAGARRIAPAGPPSAIAFLA